MENRFILYILFLLAPLGLSFAIDGASVNYLKTKTNEPWPVMALAAQEVFVTDLSHLENELAQASRAIDKEAPLLALYAQGRDIVSGQKRLLSFFDGLQLGSQDLLNDDIFGLLALSSYKDEPEKINKIKEFVARSQNQDGGWPINAGGMSDSNMTAMALIALKEAGLNNETIFARGLDYLRRSQAEDGGFKYTPEDEFKVGSDANSTAWAISAIKKFGEDPRQWKKQGGDPISYLNKLKRSDGSYAAYPNAPPDSFTPTLTSYAVIALSDKNYPVHLDITDAKQSLDLKVNLISESAPTASSSGGLSASPVNVAAPAPAASFVIDSESLDFGDLKAGQASSRMITLNNNGNVSLNIFLKVEGDEVFVNYLKIENGEWKKYNLSLDSGLNRKLEVSLPIPQNYTTTGHKRGLLTIYGTIR